MRKILVAIDSFKGSMSSLEAGYRAKEGIRRAEKELREKEGIPVEIVVKPVADGGEGTIEAVISGLGGEIVYVDAANPLGQKVRAKYGIVKDKKLAVLEMAEAAGITLLDKKDLNPSLATTYGVGEIIRDAIKRGCREFIVGIGGSATTDGGAGMLQALGFELLDEKGEELPWGIQALDKLMDIRDEKVPEELKECHFTVACDVKNPLLGLEGAVYIYGEQKGIKREEKPEFERKMACYAERTVKFTGREVRQTPGAGAAGGLGFAFLSYFNAELKPGIAVVLEALNMEKEMENADIVITGEGRLDGQTAMGKVPVGIARLAKKHGCRVLAFAGGIAQDAGSCNKKGIDAFFPIVRGVSSLEEAMEKQTAEENMKASVEQVFRLLFLLEKNRT